MEAGVFDITGGDYTATPACKQGLLPFSESHFLSMGGSRKSC